MITLTPPNDSHNARWRENARPYTWVNPKPTGRYNMVVIGAGSAGLVVAAGTAGLGGKVALIEKHHMGGDCLNTGCLPSKTLLRPAHLIGEVRRAAEMGVQLPGGYHVDFPAVMERVRRVRADVSHVDSPERFRGLGADVFFGEARFTGPDTVEVGGQTLRFGKATIATGSRAAVPPIPGLQEVGFITNETVFNLTELPPRLLVIGGGPIGCEMAQAFAAFGSAVTVIDLLPTILPRDDVDAAKVVRAALEKDGVRFELGVKPTQVQRRGENVEVTVERDGQTFTLAADAILVAAGRAPNVENLGLEAAGVEYTKRGITVNDQLQTSNPRVYAAGDVGYKYQFTHTADATARITIQNALFFGRRKASSLIVPWATYTDPELAHVGLTEAEAVAQNIAVTPFIHHFKDLDRALADGEPEGFVKVLVKSGTDNIAGATIVARRAGDMISEISVAMAGKVGLTKLATVIHPYPTQAEGIKKVADAYNRTRLTPTVKQIFVQLLAWMR
ncbi:MAG: mercuric reductase [Anaerolineales bacterium]|nr:mercuric reductase [Anaerolineales bacterium]